jgi:glycosyltransferase involved in cell wall biosynthesis
VSPAAEPFAGLSGVVVCLSSQEWDTPLWTNRQHVMSRLARRQPVVFVHTAYFLPRRLLQLLRQPDRRARTAELLGGLRRRGEGPYLLSAWNLVPFGRSRRWAARLNGRVTVARLRRTLRREGLAPAVAWAYDPMGTEVVAGLGARLRVYHCVDDHAAQVTGRRRAEMERAERDLLTRVDVVFTTARSLGARLARLHPRVHVLGNVADYDHFATAADGRAAVPDDLAAVPEPRAVFVGALNELKVDLDLLAGLADAAPDLSVVLVGPLTEAGPEARARLDALTRRPNVHALGGRPYAALPGYLAGARVGLVPYLANRYTAGVFPMKVYEYLAAGVPVVAAGLPELAAADGLVSTAASPDDFVARVREALAARDGVAERQAAARAHTWETRMAEMDRLAREALR